ncbi:bifunctional DNA primase/polymerase [Paenibacillus sp. FSL L8-0696]|uniref:bifunctional DNA primase/polymerase n=1 Tax=Paenibacillus sp. FSL L8-0696 TaxID=2954524 RepID=UPI0031192157
MKTDILLAAYQYAALSLNIIPVCSGDHSGMTPNHRATCRSPGKQPLITNWPNNGVPDKQQIDDWFRRWPTSNIGLVLGSPSGIVAIDIDGPFGHKELLHISNGDIPETWQFSTPGGGMHYLFSTPSNQIYKRFSISDPDPNSRHSELAFLGEGTYTVLPPSKHANGGIYTWIKAPNQSLLN